MACSKSRGGNDTPAIFDLVWLYMFLCTGDLNASDITMSDDDRIQLMIMVKEGKLSMHDAVEVVSIPTDVRH